jgi:hypothetical protein
MFSVNKDSIIKRAYGIRTRNSLELLRIEKFHQYCDGVGTLLISPSLLSCNIVTIYG